MRMYEENRRFIFELLKCLVGPVYGNIFSNYFFGIFL